MQEVVVCKSIANNFFLVSSFATKWHKAGGVRMCVLTVVRDLESRSMVSLGLVLCKY